MTDQKKHIVFLCSRLDVPGGIERAIVNTANLFAEKNHPVTLIILDEFNNSFYPVHPGVRIKQFPLLFGMTEKGNKMTRKLQLLRDIRNLNRILHPLNADVVIATEYQFAIAVIISGTKNFSRVYSWEHHHFNWLQKSFFWKLLFNKNYPRLDGIICLNKTEAGYFSKFAPVHLIPNFIENNSGQKAAVNTKTILSVGWLIHRKGIDFIMQAAKQVLANHPDWKWKIIGEGEMKTQLLEFIEKENQQGKLILQQPVSSDISNEYLNASIFVLASRFEAFPMVLLEAMSYGVPCVSFDCPTGPSDIITRNEDGILVEKENPAKLAEAINKLIEDEMLRNKMSEQAFENIKRFSSNKIYELWKQLI